MSLPDLDPKAQEDPAVDDATDDSPAPDSEDSPAADSEQAVPSQTEGGLEALPAEPVSPEEELAALRAERDELRASLLRRRADFENYRKRVERDRHAAAQDALATVFREIVAAVDDLERALSATAEQSDLRQGVELTYREILGMLESHGVVVVDPQGEAFDPAHHEALLHEPVPGLAEGAVAEVFRKGYSFGDRLLRPALVKVAKGEAADEANDDTENH